MRFFRRKPPFHLTGLVGSPDGLYDGSFVTACAGWWNAEVESDERMRLNGHRPYTAEEIHQLCAVVQPENRTMFEETALEVSFPGRQSAAVLCLAYAFALVINAGAAQVMRSTSTGRTGAWTRARPFTQADITELQRHYSEEGAALEYDMWDPFWVGIAEIFGPPVPGTPLGSLRASFDDQVDRWGKAEGFDLRRSLGAPDYSMLSHDKNLMTPSFVELLFEWGGRLRLGENYLAAGAEIVDYRFHHDPNDFTDHLFAEALVRFGEVTKSVIWQISDDVKLATKMAVEWLGQGLDANTRFGIYSAATRAYLWRTVEEGPVEFLEPELTEAIKRSFAAGDDRSADEPFAVTLYFAATQCMVDNVKTRLGSIGGLMSGPRSYERALFFLTTGDLAAEGYVVDDEKIRRDAFHFGVCLADVERTIARGDLR